MDSVYNFKKQKRTLLLNATIGFIITYPRLTINQSFQPILEVMRFKCALYFKSNRMPNVVLYKALLILRLATAVASLDFVRLTG